MAAPIYLTPQYITYAMIENQLAKCSVIVTIDPTPGAVGMYIGQVNDLMTKGESYIIKTVLSDFVAIPLITIKDTPFDDLVNDPDLALQYASTYAEIRDLFISSALWQIFTEYFSNSGNNNGATLIKHHANKISVYNNMIKRLDQAGNPLVKNAFAGLKRALNGSQRIARSGRVPCGIPSGEDQSWAAFNAIPNLRWGFNR